MSTTSTCSTQVISTTTVKVPPQPKSTARINLTPWELRLLFIGYSQKGLLFPKPAPDFAFIPHLHASFQRTLHFFPPLAGRLATSKPSQDATCFFVDCNGEGALFIHAAAVHVSVADALQDSSGCVPEIVASFFPLTGVRNCDGVSEPLLAVQVTELADGLFIGCSINYLLVDGTSFWHFINSWAEISGGSPTISKMPLFNRDQPDLSLPSSNAISIPDELLLIQENNVNVVVDLDKDPTLRERAFYFSKKSVAMLKEMANTQVQESEGKISSLQAILAHLWTSIIRCCHHNNGVLDSTNAEQTTLRIPIGARQRMHPPLPEEYFGNAVFLGIVTLEVGKIMEKGLGWSAWQINRMVASANGPGKAKEFYTNWIQRPELLPRLDRLPTNNFVLANSPRFNVYGNDFGWGKPMAARNGGANKFDGMIVISGGVLGEGSVEIELCLCPKIMSALCQDTEFMQFVESSILKNVSG